MGPEERLKLSYPRYEGGVLVAVRLRHKTLDDGMGVEPTNIGFADRSLADWVSAIIWCGERDSNPCHRVGNAISWPLDDPSTSYFGAGTQI